MTISRARAMIDLATRVEGEPMLKVVGLAKRMGGRDVLGGVTFEVDEGETAVVVGENGAGKSTLLRVLGGLLRPDKGEAWLLGNRLTGDEARFKAQLGYVPDSTDAFPELRTGEYLALVAALRRPHVTSVDLPEQAIAQLKVRAFWHQPISTLSFGQRKRMCTVGALIGDPWLLLFDEPSNGLDGDGVSAVLEILSRRTTEGKGAVVSTNDEPFASRLGGTRYVIRDGRLDRSPSP
jgi:ABC-type multidrug transport system ATPase subunit